MTAPANCKRLHSHPNTGWDLLYEHTTDLLCLDSYRPVHPIQIPSVICEVNTPLDIQEWSRALHTHPDRAFVRYIVAGLSNGFRIGCRRDVRLRSAKANMPSAINHPQVIDDYLQGEITKGRMLGPFPPTFFASELQINRFGVIPKGHNTGKWRLITDLSFPPDHSVNDGID